LAGRREELKGKKGKKEAFNFRDIVGGNTDRTKNFPGGEKGVESSVKRQWWV